MQSNQDEPFNIIQIGKYNTSTYAQVRRTAAGVSSVSIQTFNVLHRATKVTTGICWVETLPVVPYLINHLSHLSAISIAVSNMSAIAYRMMHKEKWIYMVHQYQLGGKGFLNVSRRTIW
jgi:hypothetical protein